MHHPLFTHIFFGAETQYSFAFARMPPQTINRKTKLVRFLVIWLYTKSNQVYKHQNMKTNFLLIIVLLASSYSYAQTPSFGVKGGLNVSNLRVKNNTTDYKAGIHLGALAHIHLSKEWAIQPEVMYSQQGGKAKTGNNKPTTNLDYINVPVLVQYMFDNGFRLEAGPQIGFLASAKSKLNGNSTDIKGDFKSTDISFPIGIGYLTSTGLGVDARWVPGLGNIQSSGSSTSNNVFQLGLFYQLPHGGHTHK